VRKSALLASAVVLASGVYLGCLDAIAPRGPVARGASLAIVPVFEGYGARDGIPGDVDSIRITIGLHNPSRDTVVALRISPGQDSITITINVPITGAFETDTVSFQAIRSSDGAVLYSGTQVVPVSVTPSAQQPIVARYVGPGQNLKSISISPPAATLKPGDVVAFKYLAVDSTGATIIGMPVLFGSRNTGIVAVNDTGLAHAGAEGTTYVVVTSGARSSVKDSAKVVVSSTAPPIASIVMQPGFAVLRPGDTATLSVSAKDASGNSVAATGVGFTSRGTGIATVGSSTGLVTGVSSGTAVIVASAGTASDSALVAVPATGSAVVSATAAGRMFASAKVGDTVIATVAVSLRAISTELLGSYNAQLVWNAATLHYVSSAAVTGGFAAPTVNETLTSTGQLRFGAADPNGSAGSVALIAVKFVGAAAGSSPLTLTLTDLSAAKTFTSLLPAALVVSGSTAVH
jgi:hypothetical protein